MKKFKELMMGDERFEGEFKRQTRLLITITLAFTIAFTWRQTIFDGAEGLIKWMTNIQNELSLSLLTSTFITLVSLLLIYLTSRWLKNY